MLSNTKSNLSISTSSSTSIPCSRQSPTPTSAIEKIFSSLDKSITSLIDDLGLDEKTKHCPKAGTMWPTDVESVVRRCQPTLDSINESERNTSSNAPREEQPQGKEDWREFLDGVGVAHTIGVL
ncbi:hypothetical protein V865_004459 [Kwoniella europaea PYCC6329]|uniref:Uncharacterized protein n=1 Tax=Kwoniella europaea PYCC6329 TaxID=1423913 RepID=A0AAX4KJX8_9TREE